MSNIVYEDYRGLWKIVKEGNQYLILNSKGKEIDRSEDFDEAYELLHSYRLSVRS